MAAPANRPGRVPPGGVDGLIHPVDLLPTLAGLSGGMSTGAQPPDGTDVRRVVAEGAPSRRTESVYGADPVSGAVRQGDWTLVWRATLLPQMIMEAICLTLHVPPVTGDLCDLGPTAD